jgi:hypothetical protein
MDFGVPAATLQVASGALATLDPASGVLVLLDFEQATAANATVMNAAKAIF